MQPTPSFKIQREISIGDIVAIITAIAAVLVSYFTLKEQLAVHTTQIAALTAEQVKQDVATSNIKKEIIDNLKDIKQDLRDLRIGQTVLSGTERREVRK